MKNIQKAIGLLDIKNKTEERWLACELGALGFRAILLINSLCGLSNQFSLIGLSFHICNAKALN